MCRFAIALLLLFGTADAAESLVRYKETPSVPVDVKKYSTTFVPEYRYDGPEIPLESLQCPIPHEDRVKNHTGIQCVYSSIEALGRWAEEPKLVDPPITSRSDCKGYSGPERAGEILKKLGVRFEQTYGDREKGVLLIKKAMREGRGALWDVPGHAMILVHYDEEGDRVCWVDNSDSSLKVQETNIERFNKRWGSWVLVVYAEPDVVPEKIYKYNFPIVDESGMRREYPRGFVPFPSLGF